MKATAVLPSIVRKEVDALLGTWSASLVAIIALATLQRLGIGALALGISLLGAVALGVQSVGHEFSGKTLTLILSQPTQRRRILLTKACVLAVMLVGLGLASLLVHPDGYFFHQRQRAAWLAMSLLCGFFIAPPLTMLCRQPFAGFVFTIATPGMLWVAGDLAAVATYGLPLTGLSEAVQLRQTVFWAGLLLVSLLGAAAGWRMFGRLELLDNRSVHITLPGLRVRNEALASSFPRRPIATLFKKELRLQSLTFVIAAFFVAAWMAILVAANWMSEFPRQILEALTLLYSLGVAVVAGSVASAEERQLHTLEWQLLLPRPSWQQWLVKTGTAYLLAMGLGLALPALLYAVTPAVRHDMAAVIVFPLLVIALLTSASLYISSLCRTSIKALLVALPAAFGFTDLINTWFILPMSEFTGAGLTTLQFDRLLPALATLHYQYLRMRSDLDLGLTLAAMPLASIGGLLTLLIYFGSRNHRSAERSLSTTLSQLACMTAVLVISGTVWSGAFDMYRERIDPGYRWMIEQQRLHPDWKFPMK